MKKLLSVIVIFLLMLSITSCGNSDLKKEFYEAYSTAANAMMKKTTKLGVPSVNEDDLADDYDGLMYEGVILWIAYLCENELLILDGKVINAEFNCPNQPNEGVLYFEKIDDFYVVDLHFDSIGIMSFFVNPVDKEKPIVYTLTPDGYNTVHYGPIGKVVKQDSETNNEMTRICSERHNKLFELELQEIPFDIFPDYERAMEEAYGGYF